MKQNSISVAVVPDKRRTKSDGTFPLKLRITNKGERKYYTTNYDANENDWALIQSRKTRGDLKNIAAKIYEIEYSAQKCCDNLPIFSFVRFEAAFFPKTIKIINVQSAFDAYIEKLKKNRQVGTASSYNCAVVSLHKFKKHLKFEHITPEFLSDFERWFTADGTKSITTVGIYTRALRTILNMAIEQGLMDAKDYPFGKRKYIIPSSKNIKKALTLEEIAKIYNYVPSNSVDEMSRDYWIFIYLCNGLNTKDLCLLKYKNIEGDFIVFNRAKTINSKRSAPEPIRVAIKDDVKRIIARWGQKKLSEDTYIFPHFTPEMTAEKQMYTLQLLIHLVNEHMKKIAKELGINKPITTYYARHSFATILKNNGVSTEFISEALGHSSLNTTRNYLAGFEHNMIKQTTDVLISFKNIRKEDAA